MITVRLEGLDAALRSIEPSIVSRAASYAINDAARSVRTETGVAIRAKFNLKAARVNKEVRNVKMALRSDLSAIIQAQGRPIGLPNYGARHVRNVGGKARTTTAAMSKVGKRSAKSTGVLARIEKGKTTHLPNAFMARGRRGNVDAAGALRVFQRRDVTASEAGGRRQPLISMATITIASMMEQDRVMARLVKKASEVLDRRFDHHLDRLRK